MRLVKMSVNQDDLATYHLFYVDAAGHPGSTLTFFPYPNGRRARTGAGMTNEVILGVPPGSLPYWEARLKDAGVHVDRADRFGEPTIAFRDPHWLSLALSESPRHVERDFAAWSKSTCPKRTRSAASTPSASSSTTRNRRATPQRTRSE